MTVDGHLGIVTVGAAEFDLELEDVRSPSTKGTGAPESPELS